MTGSVGSAMLENSLHARRNRPWLNKNFKECLSLVSILVAMVLLLLWQHILRMSTDSDDEIKPTVPQQGTVQYLEKKT